MRKWGNGSAKDLKEPANATPDLKTPAPSGGPTGASSDGDEVVRTWRASADGIRARGQFVLLALPGVVLGYLGLFFVLVPTVDKEGMFIPPNVSATIGAISATIAFGLVTVAFVRMNNARASFHEDAEARAQGAADKAIDEVTGPDDLLGLMRANKKQMEAYDTLARSQASSAHFASMIAGALGLMTIIAGVLVIVFTADTSTKYAAALVTAAGTATSGYVAKTFIRVQDGTMQQMRFYFQQPLVQSYLLSAERLVSQLPEDRKAEQFERVIGALIAQADRDEREGTVTTPPR